MLGVYGFKAPGSTPNPSSPHTAGGHCSPGPRDMLPGAPGLLSTPRALAKLTGKADRPDPRLLVPEHCLSQLLPRPPVLGPERLTASIRRGSMSEAGLIHHSPRGFPAPYQEIGLLFLHTWLQGAPPQGSGRNL